MGQTWRCVVGLEFRCPARSEGTLHQVIIIQLQLRIRWRCTCFCGGFLQKRRGIREIGQASAETKWDTHDIAKVRPRGPCDPLVGCSEFSWARVRYIGQSMPWREDRGRYCAACLPLKDDAETSRLRARMVTMSAG